MTQRWYMTWHLNNLRPDGAGNLLRFDKWNASTGTVETVRHVTNGANQIQCIDADASGTCNASETLWEYDRFGNLLTDGSTQYTYRCNCMSRGNFGG